MANFEDWCSEVVRHVRFVPDRAAIEQELTAHYEDSVADFLRIGYDRDLAASRALTALGDAEEVGRGLDRAHSYFLGWLWRVTRWSVFLAMAAVVVSLLQFGVPEFGTWLNPPPIVEVREEYTQIPSPADFSAGAYHFRFDETLYDWNEEGEGGQVLINLSAITPYVWLDGPELFDLLEAVDDRGRRYRSDRFPYTEGYTKDYPLRSRCTVSIFLDEYVPQWLEVRHKTAGWSFRIEIGGGA